jgi:hypothetical protein
MAKGQRGFEEAGRLIELASGAVEIRETPGGDNSTVRVIECLGDADPSSPRVIPSSNAPSSVKAHVE